MTKEEVVKLFDKYEEDAADAMGGSTKKVICTLCGPLKHERTMRLLVQEGIERGWYMLNPIDTVVDNNIDNQCSKKFIRTLHNLHKWKMDHSDIVIFVSDSGHLGMDSCREFIYAYKALDKKNSRLLQMQITEPLSEETQQRILKLYADRCMKDIVEDVKHTCIYN